MRDKRRRDSSDSSDKGDTPPAIALEEKVSSVRMAFSRDENEFIAWHVAIGMAASEVAPGVFCCYRLRVDPTHVEVIAERRRPGSHSREEGSAGCRVMRREIGLESGFYGLAMSPAMGGELDAQFWWYARSQGNQSDSACDENTMATLR
jgi:hypothetical protein